jgi:hypothetical protein
MTIRLLSTSACLIAALAVRTGGGLTVQRGARTAGCRAARLVRVQPVTRLPLC